MIKMKEISEKDSCWNKANGFDMVFVLIEKDLAAADTIRFWIKKRIELGKNKIGDAQLLEAEACAKYIEACQELKGLGR